MAVIIFKALEKCNANCVYCDVVKKHQDVVMSRETLEVFFQRVNEYLIEEPGEKVMLTWHGGEVCLLGADYLRHAIELQDRCCPETKARIEHLVQSNLTCITQDIIDAFTRLGVRQIGSSYEELPHIRGMGAKRDSDLYNRKFFDGAALCDRNGITWGIIYVVHKGSLARPLDIFYHITTLNLTTAPALNQVYIYGDDPFGLKVTAEEYADFLGAIFPVWWRNRSRYMAVRPFSNWVDNVVKKRFYHVCEYSGECAYRWVYVGPGGRTSQCGRAGDYSMKDYGSIADRKISDILHDTKRDEFVKRQEVLRQGECSECRFWGICHGGCPLDAFQERGGFLYKSPDCGAIRTFVEKYLEPVTGYRAEFPPPRR